MTAVTSKMNRMVLIYMLILSMVSLPTSLPKHLLVETADKGGDDYSFSPSPPFFPPQDYSKHDSTMSCSVDSDCWKPGQKCHMIADVGCTCKGGSHLITKYSHKVIKTSHFNN